MNTSIGSYNYSRQPTAGFPGNSGGYGNDPRNRMQENLSKAFSLLDDDKGQSNNFGPPRLGTAPHQDSGQGFTSGFGGGYSGAGQIQRSNYTGSDFGDSDIDNTS